MWEQGASIYIEKLRSFNLAVVGPKPKPHMIGLYSLFMVDEIVNVIIMYQVIILCNMIG